MFERLEEKLLVLICEEDGWAGRTGKAADRPEEAQRRCTTAQKRRTLQASGMLPGPRGPPSRDPPSPRARVCSPDRVPDKAASSVDTWKSRRASSTSASVAKGCSFILLRASAMRTMASNCLHGGDGVASAHVPPCAMSGRCLPNVGRPRGRLPAVPMIHLPFLLSHGTNVDSSMWHPAKDISQPLPHLDVSM